MSNFKEKKIGLYKTIINKTNVDICNNNLVIFSIDCDLKYINYVVSKENFEKYLLNINNILQKENFELREVQYLLKNDIFNVYKTRVSEKRIPQILLNILVKENILFLDNCIDYKIKNKKYSLEEIIKKYIKN